MGRVPLAVYRMYMALEYGRLSIKQSLDHAITMEIKRVFFVVYGCLTSQQHLRFYRGCDHDDTMRSEPKSPPGYDAL